MACLLLKGKAQWAHIGCHAKKNALCNMVVQADDVFWCPLQHFANARNAFCALANHSKPTVTSKVHHNLHCHHGQYCHHHHDLNISKVGSNRVHTYVCTFHLSKYFAPPSPSSFKEDQTLALSSYYPKSQVFRTLQQLELLLNLFLDAEQKHLSVKSTWDQIITICSIDIDCPVCANQNWVASSHNFGRSFRHFS